MVQAGTTTDKKPDEMLGGFLKKLESYCESDISRYLDRNLAQSLVILLQCICLSDASHDISRG